MLLLKTLIMKKSLELKKTLFFLLCKSMTSVRSLKCFHLLTPKRNLSTLCQKAQNLKVYKYIQKYQCEESNVTRALAFPLANQHEVAKHHVFVAAIAKKINV